MFERDLLGWYNIDLHFLGNFDDFIHLRAFKKYTNFKYRWHILLSHWKCSISRCYIVQCQCCLSPGDGKASQEIVREKKTHTIFVHFSWTTILMHFSIDSGFNGTILRRMFKILHLLVQPKPFKEIKDSLELERAMKHFNYTYDKLLYLLMQPCDRMLVQCAWLNQIQPCNEMFGISKSTKGYCCSFNTIEHLRYDNWKKLPFFRKFKKIFSLSSHQNQSQHYVSGVKIFDLLCQRINKF